MSPAWTAMSADVKLVVPTTKHGFAVIAPLHVKPPDARVGQKKRPWFSMIHTGTGAEHSKLNHLAPLFCLLGDVG